MAIAARALETAVLALDGEPARWGELIEEELERRGDDPVRLVLDLHGAPRIDAGALGTLVLALKRVERAGGRLTLARARPEQVELLRRTGLDRLFGLAAR